MRKTELLSQQELRWWFQILFLPLSREIIQLLTDVFFNRRQKPPTRATDANEIHNLPLVNPHTGVFTY